MRQPLVAAGHPNELGDVIVPRGQVFIPDGPIDGDPFPGVGLEVEVRQPVALAAPNERAASGLVAADPVEPAGLGVRVVAVFDEVVQGILLSDVVLAAQLCVVLPLHLRRYFVLVG